MKHVYKNNKALVTVQVLFSNPFKATSLLSQEQDKEAAVHSGRSTFGDVDVSWQVKSNQLCTHSCSLLGLCMVKDCSESTAGWQKAPAESKESLQNRGSGFPGLLGTAAFSYVLYKPKVQNPQVFCASEWSECPCSDSRGNLCHESVHS